MSECEPITQTVEASDAHQHWSEVLDRVSRRQARVVVERGGIPVAAIVAAEDLERLTRLEARRDERFAVLDEIHARNADRDPDEVERDVAEEVAAMREEQRQQRASRRGA
jgi:prevent-host-death family protein